MHSMDFDPDNSSMVIRQTLQANAPVGFGFDLADLLQNLTKGKRGRKKKNFEDDDDDEMYGDEDE
jgi:hypothetical protein